MESQLLGSQLLPIVFMDIEFIYRVLFIKDDLNFINLLIYDCYYNYYLNIKIIYKWLFMESQLLGSQLLPIVFMDIEFIYRVLFIKDDLNFINL